MKGRYTDMDKNLRQVRKNIKRIGDRLNSERGLMVRRSVDVTTSVYSHGKENKPWFTMSRKGDYKISVLKLALIGTGVVLAAAGLISILRRAAERLKRRAAHAYFDEDDLI